MEADALVVADKLGSAPANDDGREGDRASADPWPWPSSAASGEEDCEGGGTADADGSGAEAVGEDEPKDRVAGMLRAVLCIFPKVEPLSWGTFAVLSAWGAIPPVCFIILFTTMGIGEHIYFTIAIEIGEYTNFVALGLAGFSLILYMLDANEWSSRCGVIFLRLSLLTIFCGIVLLVLLIADTFPYGMACLFAIMHPLWLLALKDIMYSTKDTRVFVSWLSGPLFFISITTIAAWVAWVFSHPNNEWNASTRAIAAERNGCVPNYENRPDCRKGPGSDMTCFDVNSTNGTLYFPVGCEHSCTEVYKHCHGGFILWLGPVLSGITTFFLSFFCTFMRAEGSGEKDVFNLGAVWIFILFAMWVSASLACAARIAMALAALTFASIIAAAMFLAVGLSKEDLSQNAGAVLGRMREKYGKKLDWAKGFFLWIGAPILLIYLCLSIVNQLVRRIGIFPCSQPPGEDDQMYTTRTKKQVDVMRSWDRVNIYKIAVYWGWLYLVFQVLVSKLTTVFLSWMIEKTTNFSLGAVTGIMVGVGAIMFLLPPVPGIPVYLTLGIVLPAKGHKTMGWPGSILYSVAVALVLKLFSSALQQKGIGGSLSRFTKVRQFVGVNSPFMKSMKSIFLRNDGWISIAKVAILVGGPDWPTSVLCGIMTLPLLPIMLGTIPVIFLIAPTCLSGALIYMSSMETNTGNPEFPWAATVATIALALATAVGIGSIITAAYYLERTPAADVEAISDDIEVKEADDKAAFLNRCYHNATQWKILPLSAKVLLQASLVCIILSSYSVLLFSKFCFVKHELTDSVDQNLGGNFANLFLPLGWVVVSLFGASIIFFYLFEFWGKREARKLATMMESPNLDGLSDYRPDTKPLLQPKSELL